VATDGLVGWWPFNGNANDESGNGNNGTVNGATLTEDRFGNTNAAYSFDGADDFITNELSSPLILSGMGLTISSWLYFPFIGPNNTVPQINMIDNSGNGYGSWSTQLNTDNRVFVGLCGNAFQSPTMQINDSIQRSPNEWYNIILSCDLNNNVSRLYLNGLEIGSSNNPLLQLVLTSTTFGKWPGNDVYLTGNLDDIGIWNRALDECEIQALYNAGAQGVSPTPVSFNGLNSSYSPDDGPTTLVGSPSGGTFIGPGVTGNTFDPASAGVGTHSITYTWFDACGGFNTTGLCTTVDQGVGIGGSNMTTGGVLVYPNPNRGQFTVELELMGLVSLQVFDARGALVHNEVFTSNGSRTQRNLNLSALAKGSYTLQVQNNGGTITQQVAIQ
jgi:hypothetical protein